MLRCAKMFSQGRGAGLLVTLFLLFSGLSSAFAQGSAISTNTSSDHKKSNQSKVFHHDGMWWAIAFDTTTTTWYIWKYNGASWVRGTGVQAGADYNLDAVVDTAANKLFIFSSHTSTPRFRRYSYSGGTWVKDAGFPITLNVYANTDGNNPHSMIQAKNGYLWIFRVQASLLQGRYSTNNGSSWSAIVTIKTIGQTRGTTDAVAFSEGVDNYVGLAYGEPASATSSFGFLVHKDSDSPNTWTDETASLTYFGTERARNEISLGVDPSNRVYLFTQTNGGAPTDARNTLYMRSSAGVWSKFIVNLVNGPNWSSPAAAIDTENSRLLVMGTNTFNGKAEYKAGLLGVGSDLQSATKQTLFSSGSDVFQNLSVPTRAVDAAVDLMITVGDTTTKDTYFNLFDIPATVPITINSVVPGNSSVNVISSYTIGMTTSANGMLASNFSTATVRFPHNTVVPALITPGDITVNGSPATVAASNAATREITFTLPINVGNSTAFSVVFSAAIGLLNPTIAGPYTLNAWTSTQPLLGTSPSYNLTAATTTVSAVNATPFPADVDSAAQYTVGFRVGGNGRLLADSSKIVICFENDTQVTNGVLSGVTVNGVAASATGDNANRRLDVKVPAAVTINNNDSATVIIPPTALINPSRVDTFYLQVNTTVETTKITSNGFYIHKGRRIAATTKNFERGNQSKMFYHDGFWWLAAQSNTNNFWYLWKRSDTTWTRTTQIHNQGKSRPDCILDVPNNRLYILLPGSSTASITRLSYSGGSWTVDSGYPKTVSSVQDKTMNLARAINGNLWVFWIADSTLLARRSSNEGSSWGSDVVVKDSLNTDTGLTDAVAFSDGGEDWIGVGYAEDNSNNGAVFGFLRHEDGDGPTVWEDESSSVPQFNGTFADDHVSMMVYNNEVFMCVKTEGGGGSTTTKVGLLHRATGGTWNAYSIINDNGWTRPVLAIDETNSMIYVFGSREGAVEYLEGKSVALGSYNSFVTAPIDTFMHYYDNDFFDPSSPSHTVTGASNLLIAASNKTGNATWVQLIDLPDGVIEAESQAQLGKEAPAVQAAAAKAEVEIDAFPNPFNPSTQLQFTLTTAATVKLQIFNVTGQLVKTLIDNDLSAGTHRRIWRGTNLQGQHVSSGTYFYRLQVGALARTGRLYMVK